MVLQHCCFLPWYCFWWQPYRSLRCFRLSSGVALCEVPALTSPTGWGGPIYTIASTVPPRSLLLLSSAPKRETPLNWFDFSYWEMFHNY